MIVPEEIRKCVVFMCYQYGPDVRLAGTGFFVAVPSALPDKAYIYLVTARHVIEAIREKSTDGRVLIRVNLVGSGAQVAGGPIEEWKFHPSDSTLTTPNWKRRRE